MPGFNSSIFLFLLPPVCPHNPDTSGLGPTKLMSPLSDTIANNSGNSSNLYFLRNDPILVTLKSTLDDNYIREYNIFSLSGNYICKRHSLIADLSCLNNTGNDEVIRVIMSIIISEG